MGASERIKKKHLNSKEGQELLSRLLVLIEGTELDDQEVIAFNEWLNGLSASYFEIPAIGRLRELSAIAISRYGPYCYWDKKKVLDEAIIEMLPRKEARRIADCRREAQELEDNALGGV